MYGSSRSRQVFAVHDHTTSIAYRHQLHPAHFRRFQAASKFRRRFIAPFASSQEPAADPDMVVRWIPELDTTREDIEPTEGATVLPLFPAEQTLVPYSSPDLVIVEPRDRAICNDILLSGVRKFLVCNVDKETRRFAEVGAVVHVYNFQEVYDEVRDRTTYVGNFSVIGRGKVVKVLNPKATKVGDKYLRAEVSLLEDCDREQDVTVAEESVQRIFQELIDAQTRLGETPRFTEGLKSKVSFRRGLSFDEPGVWRTIAQYQDFLKRRSEDHARKLRLDINTMTIQYVMALSIVNASDSTSPEVLREYMRTQMPESISKQLYGIKRRYREAVDETMGCLTGPMFQSMLQSDSHVERLSIFQHILKQECNRLAARASLKSLFKN